VRDEQLVTCHISIKTLLLSGNRWFLQLGVLLPCTRWKFHRVHNFTSSKKPQTMTSPFSRSQRLCGRRPPARLESAGTATFETSYLRALQGQLLLFKGKKQLSLLPCLLRLTLQNGGYATNYRLKSSFDPLL
jgi:hypothetical protein